MDKAYAFGVSGDNGWQRLFEGTMLRDLFDWKPQKRYDYFMDSTIGDHAPRRSNDTMVFGRNEEDLEASWVEDLGLSWKVRDSQGNTA
jgi:hypothetical protein